MQQTLTVAVQDKVVHSVDDVRIKAGPSERRWTASCISAGRGQSIWRCWLTGDTANCRSRADYVGKNVPTSLNEEVKVLVSETDGQDGVYIS